jgi:uncharacterized protein (DUF362 family)
MTQCFTQCDDRVRELVKDQMASALGRLRPSRIVLKPNWVLHESDPAFPIRALVTDARVIDAAVQACLDLFPSAESILVGDCPLQSAEWPRMCDQSGLTPVIEKYRRVAGDRVRFRDLRREVFQKDATGFMVPSDTEHGDPRGYQEVCLGARSHLEPISDQAHLFAVNDYTSSVTRSNHRKGDHRYLVSQSVLDSDLFINLPKWKSHAKSGLTCALKNLVGINGDKAYLPHFRRGAPKWGGDEYKDESRWLYWAQTTLREKLQKRSQWAFRLLKPGWEMVKRLRGIETRLTDRNAKPREFYVAGGAWHGNQTIWRMIYDLNLILQCVDRNGTLWERPQRHYFCIVDGLVSGEGNGPLQPLPRDTGWLAFGSDPFALDASLAWFMGFDPRLMPVIQQHQSYLGPDWGDFDLDQLSVDLDGIPTRVLASPVNLHFVPPPGWRGQIERERQLVV